jgi:hypothetical protein
MATRTYVEEPGIVGFLRDIPTGITHVVVDSYGALWYQPSIEGGYITPWTPSGVYPNSANVYLSIANNDDYVTCSPTQSLTIRKANSGASISVDNSPCTAIAIGDLFVFRLINEIVRVHWRVSGVVETAAITIYGQTITDIAAVGIRLYLLTSSRQVYVYKGGITTLWRAADARITGLVRSFNTLCILYDTTGDCYDIYGDAGIEVARSSAANVVRAGALLVAGIVVLTLVL